MGSEDPKGESDPVYGQKRQLPKPSEGPSREKTQASGGPDHQSDPVYSQNANTSTSRDQPVHDPVYGQSRPAPAPMGSQDKSRTQGGPSHATDPVYSQNANEKATSRLAQVSSQITPSPSEASVTSASNTKKSRKSKPRSSAADPSASLPADYDDILEHARTMHSTSWTPDTTSRGYQRQLTSGKLWARDRIKKLLDPDSWREIGSLTGSATWRPDPENPQREHVESFVPTNNPQGFGVVTCPVTGLKKEIYLTADDFSIRGGHADGGNTLKTVFGEKLAIRLKKPVVKLCDGSSGGGSVTTIKQLGYSYLPDNKILWPAALQLNEGIPNIGAIVGPAIGLGAARVVCTHFSVMAADVGSLFNAGPKVVEGATFEEDLSFQELGGPDVHCRNGTIDNVAKDEEDVFRQIRTVLGYLPDSGSLEAPPCVQPTDDINREDIALRSIIPRRKGRGYNPWSIILSVVDKGSWFEIGALWGRTAIVGLARMGGKPVGIISLNCEVNSGALDHGGSQKMTKHLKFCDVFNLPIVQFVDCRMFHPS
jgi:acetyl-CoA carboxylase carboxyltransferase component